MKYYHIFIHASQPSEVTFKKKEFNSFISSMAFPVQGQQCGQASAGRPPTFTGPAGAESFPPCFRNQQCHAGAVRMLLAGDRGKRQAEGRCVREGEHPPFPVLAVEEFWMPTCLKSGAK